MNITAYKNPFNLLILLGFICQSFSGDNYLLPLIIFVLTWLICIRFRRKTSFFPKILELFLFLFVLILSFRFGGDNYFSRCLALGNAFVVLQAIRLLAPLNKRDKLFSTAMALTQVAVGSQVILGYSFILIIFAVLYLLPKALYCIQVDKMFILQGNDDKQVLRTNKLIRGKIFFNFSFSDCFLDRFIHGFIIFVVMILFFLLLPRGYTVPGSNLIGRGFGFELKKPILEMSDGGRKWASDQLLFKIYGPDISYLKCFSLDSFDGNTWTASSFSFRNVRTLSRKEYSEDSLYRKVDITISNYKRLYLPTDGYVESIRGNFFYHPSVSAQGNVTILINSYKKNRMYEYWTNPEPPLQQLSGIDIKQYTAYPETSEKLKNWLAGILNGETSPYKQANIIKNYLKDNFVYEIGTPELDKQYPVEDLIFNKKKGHCARFASAMAVLLRMKGIPSRVVIGYFTIEKNEIADYYKVRGRNAHAWVEGYIEGRGWVIFDATPYASDNFHLQNLTGKTTFSIFRDWCEYFWYSKIVNFSRGDQTEFIDSFIKIVQSFIKRFVFLILPAGAFTVIFLLIYFAIKLKRFISNFWLISKPKKKQLRFAGHFYGRMLKVLAHDKIYRNDNQTPLELLLELEKQNYPKVDKIRFITELFCSVRYGNAKMTMEQKNAVQKAYASIKNKQV